MMDDQKLLDLLVRVRDGDETAATQLVTEYEPQLRRFIRYRLTRTRLRNLIDSLDISQSVFARLFAGLADGRLDVTHPKQLCKLLFTIAGNRLHDHIRRQTADKRAHQKASGDAAEVLAAVAGDDPDPASEVADAELFNLLRAQLAPDELQLLDERLEGRGWNEIADQLAQSTLPGETKPTAEGLRKRFTRAIDRAAAQLGLTST
jgi:RNA polymerase sigma factor (sigma-70 family)